MNKTAIKNFAIWARNKLRSEIAYKAGLLGISEKGIAEPLPQSTDDLQIFDIGTSQPVRLEGKTAIEQRRSLVAAIKAKRLPFAEAFDAVIEEVAYTWFNRLIAVRFMEVNDYLPSRMRVLSSDNSAKAEPDFVTSPFDTDIEFTDAEKDHIDELKDHSKSDELFQFMFIRQCNKLNEILPELFEKTNDYTELLLNVSFTDKDGIVYHLVHDIPEDDFNIEKEGQVEIIGWLYQYYNTEPKDKVFSRPSGQKIRKEDVPAATQLFTPDWIVRYMVENSLGRTWTDIKPDTDLKSEWKYYLSEAEQSDDVQTKLLEMRKSKAQTSIEEITFLDPCMGSGHILVYAFDVFMQIYTSQGYTERDAAQKIVENNLYGLELDDRAAQLAYFAVMMKARSYDRRFLGRGIRPNLCSIKESNNINPDYLELFGELKATARKLYDEFIDAKEYGSILNLKITAEEIAQLEEKCSEIIDGYYDNIIDTICQVGIRTDFPALLRQAKIMVSRYDVVCTNPPYMGNMPEEMTKYVRKHYANEKYDLYAVVYRKALNSLLPNGYVSMITQQAWMFLSSFEKLRKELSDVTICNLIQLGSRAFEEISGEVVQTVAFTIMNNTISEYKGKYKDLTKGISQDDKNKLFFATKEYVVSQKLFEMIPGNTIAYWIPKSAINLFSEKRVSDYSVIKSGIVTGDNSYFLRMWHEITFSHIGFNHKSFVDNTNIKWVPMHKGGGYRKHYGLHEYIMNLHDIWEPEKTNASVRKGEPKYYFKSGLTWSTLSNNLSIRQSPTGFVFDTKGSMCFLKTDNDISYFEAFFNSKVAAYYMGFLSPTLDFNQGAMSKIPIIHNKDNFSKICEMSIDCVGLSKADWDSFETSWDFERHPIVPSSAARKEQEVSQFAESRMKKFGLISWHFEKWQQECEARFNKLKANEEELNRIFIDIYGLQDELTPEVEDKDVTVRKADLTREIKSLISYAVGCMFGRYSLNCNGLIFAGGDFDKTYWRFKGQAPLDDNGNPIYGGYAGISNAKYHYPRFRDSDSWENATQLLFEPDDDNCIPITDTKYFDDDIVGRFCEFIKVVYGEDTLEENLEFIAQALGNKGNSSRDVIRSYFLNDFYKDHCKIYQKRPIYWLFDSGKQNGFKALIYIHRYNADTIGNLRVEYLHRVQRIYESEIEREQDTIDHTTNAREKKVSENRKEKLQRQLKETKEYDEKIAHLALSRIEIDLDDGVKTNYDKIQTGRDGKKLDVLGKI